MGVFGPDYCCIIHLKIMIILNRRIVKSIVIIQENLSLMMSKIFTTTAYCTMVSDLVGVSFFMFQRPSFSILHYNFLFLQFWQIYAGSKSKF